jgi:tetratricopeptide (TPR) repeat protein
MAKGNKKAIHNYSSVIKTKQPERSGNTPTLSESSVFSWPLALVLIGFTFLVLKNCLSLGFVDWDDTDTILNNDTLAPFSRIWKWQNVLVLFKTHVLGAYIPLPVFSFAIEKYFFAHDPLKHATIFHATNLILHTICTFIVYCILSKMLKNRYAVLFGALLFGIHPMRIESVAWVTERKDVLYGVFFLMAVYSFIRYIQSTDKKIQWYILTIVCSIFSYFSKIQAVTLPLTFIVIDFYFSRDWYKPKILIIEKLPWWVLSILFGCINIFFLQKTGTLQSDESNLNYGFIGDLSIGAYSYAVYLYKLILPYPLSPLYPYPIKLNVLFYGALILLPVILFLIIKWAWTRKHISLITGIAFFTFNVMFMLQIVQAGQCFLADRYTYIAYFGLFFLAAKAIEWILSEKPALTTITYAGMFIYIVALSFLSNTQIKIWKNTGTLWEHTLTLYPENYIPWSNAANYYNGKGDLLKAINYYKKALPLQTEKEKAYNNLSKSYTDYALSFNNTDPSQQAKKKELLDSALTYFNKGYAIDSAKGSKNKLLTAKLLINRGVCKAGLGLYDDAIIDIQQGLYVDSLNKKGWNNLAVIYIMSNQNEAAIKSLNALIRMEPYNGDMYLERGVCKARLSLFNDALIDINKAISLNNNSATYYLERAKINKIIGNNKESVSDAMRAKELGAVVPEVFFK